MDTTKPVKMKFSCDQYYGKAVDNCVVESMKTPLYLAGVVYEIDPKMVPRWIKRGGEIVEDSKPLTKVEAVDKQPTKTEETVETKGTKEEDGPKPGTSPAAGKGSKSR
jgi:hypothetical protein